MRRPAEYTDWTGLIIGQTAREVIYAARTLRRGLGVTMLALAARGARDYFGV